jgi:hypothetical protein
MLQPGQMYNLRRTACRSAAASADTSTQNRNDLAREAVGCNGVFGA